LPRSPSSRTRCPVARQHPRLDGHLRLQLAPARDPSLAQDAADANSAHDFGEDVLPAAIAGNRQVFAYPFQDVKTRAQSYWRDVGTIDATTMRR
jgi:NDP-sugar pyrophosphorylase family protein